MIEWAVLILCAIVLSGLAGIAAASLTVWVEDYRYRGKGAPGRCSKRHQRLMADQEWGNRFWARYERRREYRRQHLTWADAANALIGPLLRTR